MDTKNKFFVVLLLTLTIIGGGTMTLYIQYTDSLKALNNDFHSESWINTQEEKTLVPYTSPSKKTANKQAKQGKTYDTHVSDEWTLPSAQMRDAMSDNARPLRHERRTEDDNDSFFSQRAPTSDGEFLAYGRNVRRSTDRNASTAAGTSIVIGAAKKTPRTGSEWVLVDPAPLDLQEEDQIGHVPVSDGLPFLALTSVLYAVVCLRRNFL